MIGSRLTRGALLASRTPPAPRSASNTGFTASSTTSLTLNSSSVVRVGDVLLLIVTLFTTTDTITTPAGWAFPPGLSGPVDSSGTGTNMRTYLFTKVATVAGVQALPLTKVGTGASWRAQVTAWGASAGVGAVTSSACTNLGDTTPVLPSVVPTTDYATWVGLIQCRVTQTGIDPPARALEVFEVTGSNLSLHVCRNAPVPAAAPGAAAAACSSATKWTALSVALSHL